MTHRKAILRIGVAGLGVLLSLSCLEDTPALFIVHNSSLDDGCRPVVQTSISEFVGSGTMDVTVARQYTMFPRVENLMSSSTTGRGGGAGSTYEGNRVTLSRAEISFSAPRDFSVPLPRGIDIPISGTLEPNDAAVVVLEVVNQALGEQLAASPQLADRGSTVRVTASIRFFGVTTSGRDVESNSFTYPITLCRGCLLEFPLEASDPLDSQPNCRGGLSDENALSDFELSCFPGQDNPLDCRVCRILVTSQGKDEQEVERSCEPAPGS